MYFERISCRFVNRKRKRGGGEDYALGLSPVCMLFDVVDLVGEELSGGQLCGGIVAILTPALHLFHHVSWSLGVLELSVKVGGATK